MIKPIFLKLLDAESINSRCCYFENPKIVFIKKSRSLCWLWLSSCAGRISQVEGVHTPCEALRDFFCHGRCQDGRQRHGGNFRHGRAPPGRDAQGVCISKILQAGKHDSAAE